MYPPEPWHLRGQMWLSLFLVRRSALPETVRPALFGLVGAAWVRYEPGGTLDYRELVSAALVRDGWRPRVSVMDIWVDSVTSRDGGRALWGIPKELSTIDIGPTAGGTDAAAVRVTPGLRVPGRWPVALSLIQALGNGVRRTAVRGTTRLRLSRATWNVPPDGPLGYLAGRRPLWTVTLTDFRLRFGGT